MSYRTGLFTTALLAAGSICQASPAVGAPGGDPVINWNANAGSAAVKACISPIDNPFHEGRMYGMMHIAIHDALNAIDRKYEPYAFDKKADPDALPDAAVAAAAHDVLVRLISQFPLVKKDCIDAGIASVEAAYTAALNAVPNGPAKDKGIALGQQSAAAILTKRSSDHSDVELINKNCPSPQPGKFQCVPGFPFVAFEAWEQVTPFTLKDNAQFQPGPPYALTDPKYAADLAEVKALGGDGKTTPSARTDDQTQAALFWLESSPLKWSRIARTVAASRELTPWQCARLFAVLNMALADGYIAMVTSKNHYDFWRPVTAIQSGGDPSWTPLRPTPPDQDYPSGHSIEGGVGAEVLKQVFGTDQITFQDCGMTLLAGSTCTDPTPTMRTYTSFSQAADENAWSRVLVGFHFRTATEVGNAYGHKIGENAANAVLRPVATNK